MTTTPAFIPDARWMRRALDLALRGQGRVEPNPMVGCVVVQQGRVVGEGWHDQFGGPHAEVVALSLAGSQARHSDLYVTLEPCAHQGKTPPCTAAILAAGVARVAAAVVDPHKAVAGRGVAHLRQGGVLVHVGLEEQAARDVLAPYWKLVVQGAPWVIGKWAMTLDGKIAAANGDSRWISNAVSRAVAHRLRGRMDAILVGRVTAQADDPLLTARPPGPRTALRVVVDSRARLNPGCRLLQSLEQGPVLLVAGPLADSGRVARLRQAGAELLQLAEPDPDRRLTALLAELGRRQITNLLVEGGGQLLGSLRDLGQLDEVHVFLAPHLLGGASAPGPLAGRGAASMEQAWALRACRIERCGEDTYIHGRLTQPGARGPTPPSTVSQA